MNALFSLNMRIITSALIGVAAVGLLAGCGPSSSSTEAAGASTPADGTSATSTSGSANSGSGSSGGGTAAGCPTASDVSASLGISGLATQTSKAVSTQGHSGFACVYMAGAKIVSVTLVNGITGSFLSSAAQKASTAGGTLTTVSGFADQAYSLSISVATLKENELIARKGSVEAVVASAATLSQEEALVQSIFAANGA
jgi:hypothetical protein